MGCLLILTLLFVAFNNSAIQFPKKKLIKKISFLDLHFNIHVTLTLLITGFLRVWLFYYNPIWVSFFFWNLLPTFLLSTRPQLHKMIQHSPNTSSRNSRCDTHWVANMWYTLLMEGNLSTILKIAFKNWESKLLKPHEYNFTNRVPSSQVNSVI